MNDRLGKQFGNYRLARLLGEGGFVEVYLGDHIHLGTQAAIKVLHTRLSNEDREQFRNEARTVARLVHPNIVRVLDFGIEDRIPFLVMDYARRGSLRERHPKGTKVSLQLVASYVKQVAQALQYAHEQHLIHRDIKPENMLLGSNNEVLLSDFGIAVASHSSRSAQTEDRAGTIYYMAPEQIQGKPRRASDQYALAVVVYEWLTGARLFTGTNMEIITQHLTATPPSLHLKDSTIPPAVEQVIMIALAKDPDQRFASVRTFARYLEEAINSTILPSQLPPLNSSVAAISRESFIRPLAGSSPPAIKAPATRVRDTSERKQTPTTPVRYTSIQKQTRTRITGYIITCLAGVFCLIAFFLPYISITYLPTDFIYSLTGADPKSEWHWIYGEEIATLVAVAISIWGIFWRILGNRMPSSFVEMMEEHYHYMKYSLFMAVFAALLIHIFFVI